MDPERERELTLIAEAEFRRRKRAAAAETPSPERGTSLADVAGLGMQGAAALGRGTWNAVKGLGQVIASPVTFTYNKGKEAYDKESENPLSFPGSATIKGVTAVLKAPTEMPRALVETIKGAVVRDPIGTILPTVGGVVGSIPGAVLGGAAASLIKDYLDGDVSAKDQFSHAMEAVGENIALPVVLSGAGKAANAFSRRTETGALYRARKTPGMMARSQGAGGTSAEAKTDFIQPFDDYADEFAKRDLMKGIDPASEAEGFAQYKGRLNELLENGSKTKQAVLSEISKAEEAQRLAAKQAGLNVPVGLKYSDLDTSWFTKGINGKSEAQKIGLYAAQKELQKEFFEPQMVLQNNRMVPTGEPNLTRPVSKNISEFSDALQRIDNRLKDLGAFDSSPIIGNQAEALANSHLKEGLYTARRTLADGLAKYVKREHGEVLGDLLAKSNDDIFIGKTYGGLAERFESQAGQSSALRSDATLVNTVSSARGMLDRLIGGKKRARDLNATSDAFRRAINETQLQVGWRNGTTPPPLLSRDIGLMRTNPEAMSMVTSLAVNIGIAPETFSNPSSPMYKSAIAQVAQTFPQFFEPNEDGLNSTLDNKIHDPAERSMYAKMAMDKFASGEIDRKDEPKIMGRFLENNTYTPLSKPASAPQKPVAGPVAFSLKDVYGALSGPSGGPNGSVGGIADSYEMLRRKAGGISDAERLISSAEEYPPSF